METSIQLRDGETALVTVTGRGRPIVLVHGWGMGPAAFGDLPLRLAREAQVITFRMRGHQPDTPLAMPPTVEMVHDDLSCILAALALSDVTALGWSLGAMVAWRAAVDPDLRSRITAVISVDMSPRVTNDASWSLGVADGRGPAETLAMGDAMVADWAGFAPRVAPRIFAPGNLAKHAAQCDAITAEMAPLDPAPMAALWQSMAMQDLRLALPHITVPVLAAHGAQSLLYQVETGRHVAEAVQRGHLAVFAQSGHAPHLEEPDPFARAVLSFMAQSAAPAVPLSKIRSVKKSA